MARTPHRRWPLLTLLCLTISGCTAEREDRVTVRATVQPESIEPILAAFERESEVEVQTRFAGSPDAIAASSGSAEAAAKIGNADVFWDAGVMNTVRLQKRGLLQPRDFPVDRSWPDSMIASNDTWCGFAARARVLIVNRDSVNDSEAAPNSVGELTDPRWKGRCGMAHPLVGTSAAHWAVLRDKQGREATLAQLAAIRDNARILPGNQEVARAVSAGKLAWGLTDSDHAIAENDLDYPVEIVFPDQDAEQPGTLRIPNTVAVLKTATHPVAAAALVDFLITPEIEDRLAMGPGSYLPISRESKFPPAVLPEEPVRWMRVDFETAAQGWEAWASDVREVLDQK